MNFLKTIFIIVFLIGFNGFILQAQKEQVSETNYYFDHISVQDGLSQGSVLSIHQDRLGFMWLGTRDGLNRYDGYNFKVFKNQLGDSTSISGNIIRDIKEDAFGNVWVANEKGLSKYNADQEQFYNYPLNSLGNKNLIIDVIFISKEQKIWVGGNFGIFLFNPENGEYGPDLMREYDNYPSKKYSVNSIQQKANGNLLIGTSKKGVFVLDFTRNTLRSFNNYKVSQKPIRRIQSIVVRNTEVWAGTYGNGLYRFDQNGNTISHYHTEATNPDHRIADDHIRALQLDGKDLWIGTFKGLNVLKNLKQITTINYQKGNPKGLPHNSVRSLFKDRKGSIWVGTYFGGASIYDIHNQRFKHYYNISGDNTSLSYDVVGAFETDTAGTIFIGTERGGLNIYDPKTNEHTKLADSLLSKSIIKSLYRDQENTLWVSVFKQGLHYFDSEQKILVPVYTTQSPLFNDLKNAIINCIIPDNHGNLWIGTDEKGLQKFDYKTKKFQEYLNREKLNFSIKGDPIKSIALKEDHLYLATKGSGIIHFDPKLGTIEQITRFKEDDIISEVREFNHISLDRNGIFWLATNGKGILTYDPVSKQSKRWHIESGLSSNIALGTLHGENSKNTWIITTDMIAEVSFDQEDILKSYSYTSGFPLEEINEGAFLKTNFGMFLIGGSNGYVKFSPEDLSLNTFSPQPILTTLNLFNKQVKPNDENKILTKDISKTSEITLDHFQSVFSIEFASLNYTSLENNQYAYMLKGFDKDWIYEKNRREATYTNLPDGTYTFLVKSANNDNIWNENPTSLQISILPPPWRTWWAYIIYLSLIGLAFYVIRYNAIKSTQLKNDFRIEQLEKEKWKEIHDLKLKYFIDVSHEFRTPLTLILGPLEEMISSKSQEGWLRSRIKIMYFNAKRLSLLINQILEIREIETGHSKLKKEPTYIDSMLQDIVDSFKGIADKNQIALSLKQHSISEKPVLADKDKLQKIFFNLLSNAFKFTPEGGKIKVEITSNENEDEIQYFFRVSDTGIGISPDKLTRVFDRFYKGSKTQLGAGIGLSLTKSLIDIMNGTIDVTSTEGKGTSFILNIPFKVANVSLEKEENKFTKPIPLEYQNTKLVRKKTTKEELTKETILLVEDNEELLNYLQEQLRDDYIIFTAKNGIQGLKKVKKIAPDIVISDVMMPKMDGLELCHHIKKTKELCHIPVLLLTAKDSQIHKIEGLEHGADDYIGKPFNFTELKTRIKNIISNRNLIQQKFRDNDILPKLQKIKINSYDEKLMKNILKTIGEQFDKPNFTVDYLSSEVGLSRVHLTRKLKALAGVTPAEYIKNFRMKQAIEMLKNGSFKIADIAYAVGYQDVQYFSKTFKAKYGSSPAKYVEKEEEEI
ncbi:two-component regulator propeller domain-containing protein [Aquimarina gracilis]|uniref:histidine kinase n=1 Tax=Aquimarina gracilis TaxID=874422 RepID=A0ABU5ZQC3_9FLAO|nr:two-component regulator propeller domain-containing protein [Aquimarina gracilis]MEB3343878.1 two-component regulator propeller domain-containing protein [Aquimarina gracilis]